MAGTGELFKGKDGTWAFRVKASDGQIVATDGGAGYSSEAAARTALRELLRGGLNGPITTLATVACGQEITENTTLDGDLLCTAGPALIVTADNVTLNLGGHTVSGTGGSPSGTPGILVRNVKGCTVRKGTVAHFGAGIAIVGGSGNLVENMTLEDNVGTPDGDFGDGIVVSNSSGNRIQANTVRRNGPFSGISLVGPSAGNHILHNVVADNNMLPGVPAAGRQDMGIRIEGPAANDNIVEGNTVTGSGSNGIVVLPTCDNPATGCAGTPANEGNEIHKNMSHNNGTSGKGDGIRLFSVANPVAPAHNTITENFTDGNTTNGVAVDAIGTSNPGPTENKISHNSAHGNGQFDGFDGNTTPLCGTNTWEANDFGTVNQPCVLGKATPKLP